MKTKNFPGNVNERRVESMSRLKAQLTSNTKNVKSVVHNIYYSEELTEKDIKRINREISTLNDRLDPNAFSSRSKKARL